MEPIISRPNERPPIVVIVGHIDHGKSTLLDYIRRTNVVASETGGITQYLSAYEAEHKTSSGLRHITFLDTPGHEAFRAMRMRGLEVADVAILVVSAEEGAKQQTLEALKLIEDVHIPYIVALTKIDKPNMNIERAKMSLLEHGVLLEGMGGEVPYVAVSGKTGEGVSELLDLILLAAELEGLTADPTLPGRGIVIEAHVDPRRGNTATLIVQDGTLRSGEFVVAKNSYAPVRIMENFLGIPIKEAPPGSPVRVVGFSILPPVGEKWRTLETKKQAEEEVAEALVSRSAPIHPVSQGEDAEEERKPVILPFIIKTDVAGTGEAIIHEIGKLSTENQLEIRIVRQGVGSITESDVRLAGAGQTPGIILGFNVKVEREAKDIAERLGVTIAVFDIIYKLTEWLTSEIETRRPRARYEETRASARLVKVFSSVRGRCVVGGRVEEGTLTQGNNVKILRRDLEIGRGEIVSLQMQKSDVKKVENGQEFGAMIKTGGEPASGDYLIAYEIVQK